MPGAFAAAEARKALARGLNVMMFSDNVPIADEVALKQEARAKGLLMMGPDCGTAIIGGVPLAFANVVPRGDIGIVGASGTGIQEVSCLIANNGGGISHAIGTGGRDLKAEVGGITTLDGDRPARCRPGDPPHRHHLEAAGRRGRGQGAGARRAVEEAVHGLLHRRARRRGPGQCQRLRERWQAQRLNTHSANRCRRGEHSNARSDGRARHVRGLFAGGTLCAEAQFDRA